MHASPEGTGPPPGCHSTHPHVVLAAGLALGQSIVYELTDILLVLRLDHPGCVHVDGHGGAVARVCLQEEEVPKGRLGIGTEHTKRH